MFCKSTERTLAWGCKDQIFCGSFNCEVKESESESRSVVSDSSQPHGLYSPWSSPGQNTGVGSLSLLQRIFPTHGSNTGLPHRSRILYQLSHKGSPVNCEMWANFPKDLMTSNVLLYLQFCIKKPKNFKFSFQFSANTRQLLCKMSFQIYKYNLVRMLGRKIKMDFDARFVNSLGFLHDRAKVRKEIFSLNIYW